MKKRISILALIMTALFALTACAKAEVKNTDEKLSLGVTIYPLQYFAERIGGEKVNVFSIIPDGSDAHSFDPKPKDLSNLTNTDMFIYNGLEMEEWIDSVLEVINGTEVKILEASTGIDPLPATEDDNHDLESEEEHEEDEEEHGHGAYDPHVWLSLDLALVQAENIKNKLVEIDLENKDYYEDNFNGLKNDLTSLKDEFTEKMKSLSNKEFVTGHAAFGYLTNDFGLTQSSIADVFGEGELTAKNLESLISYSKEHNVKVIFSESTASSKEAETLAKEIGATVEKIYSLETKEDNLNYLDGMRYNLEKIYESLSK